MAEKIVILGAGGTGILLAESVSRTDAMELAGFLDDGPAGRKQGSCGLRVLGGLRSWADLPEAVRFVSSLYSPKRNAEFALLVESLGIPAERWATVIDPSAWVSRSAELGAGCYVGPGCVVEPQAVLGERSVLLGNVYVAHDAQLGSYVCCANSASLAGRVVVGESAFVGANASIRGGVRIGAGSVVGMGSVVLRDVADGQTVAGNPARVLEGG